MSNRYHDTLRVLQYEIRDHIASAQRCVKADVPGISDEKREEFRLRLEQLDKLDWAVGIAIEAAGKL